METLFFVLIMDVCSDVEQRCELIIPNIQFTTQKECELDRPSLEAYVREEHFKDRFPFSEDGEVYFAQSTCSDWEAGLAIIEERRVKTSGDERDI